MIQANKNSEQLNSKALIQSFKEYPLYIKKPSKQKVFCSECGKIIPNNSSHNC